MKQNLLNCLFLFAFISIIGTGCKTTENSLALKGEAAKMEIQESPEALSYYSIKTQQVPSFTERGAQARGNKSRGIVLGPLLGSAVSLGTDAVKKMIAKDRAKYVAKYNFALTDLYFYDQLSTESVFDPVGLQFSGFILVRTFTNNAGLTDTAFIARFDLDTTSPNAPNEIINNSIFRLRLKDLRIFYSKAKMTAAQKNTINMDIEISFRTTYVNELGQLFDNVELGKFYLLLRNAPMDKKSPGYEEYYEKLKGSKVDGRSFIVPRSFGYYKTSADTVAKSYSQGAYSITAKVTETAKDKFVTKILVDNSSNIIDMLGKEAKKKLMK